jgi:hypothetical protein
MRLRHSGGKRGSSRHKSHFLVPPSRLATVNQMAQIANERHAPVFPPTTSAAVSPLQHHITYKMKLHSSKIEGL